MIEARQSMADDIGQKDFSMSVYNAETYQIEVLSSIFSWLVEILKAQGSLYSDNIESGSVTEEIRSKLHQQALCLKKKQSFRLSSSDVKEKNRPPTSFADIRDNSPGNADDSEEYALID